ncbi:MAG TPA: hypothetical protein VK430_00735 [Xanthobacteraceae bacterium]|nr:hypothetical protein [Xanthobacteraceae bacterium]
MHPIWRLSEGGEDNLGLCCSEDGLVLGRTPLIERRGQRFIVREGREIERLLSRGYGTGSALVMDRLMPGLATVAFALNANDQCLAQIAAVHLRIPDLPNEDARREMEAEDILLKSANWDPAHKASPDDPKHPGWPAGTEGGRGGKFRPKDGSEAVVAQEIKDRIVRIALRRALRTAALAVLRVVSEGATNIIPFLGFAADVAMLVDMARTIAEFAKLAIDAAAALDFVEKGPHSFEDLQVSSSEYEEFSSYDRFLKIGLSLQMAKRFGSAGEGRQYHHIVTQGGENEALPPEQLHNTENIINLPTLLHEAVNGKYSERKDGTNMTNYQWLQTQPYDVQRMEGLKILRDLNILE